MQEPASLIIESVVLRRLIMLFFCLLLLLAAPALSLNAAVIDGGTYELPSWKDKNPNPIRVLLKHPTSTDCLKWKLPRELIMHAESLDPSCPDGWHRAINVSLKKHLTDTKKLKVSAENSNPKDGIEFTVIAKPILSVSLELISGAADACLVGDSVAYQVKLRYKGGALCQVQGLPFIWKLEQSGAFSVSSSCNEGDVQCNLVARQQGPDRVSVQLGPKSAYQQLVSVDEYLVGPIPVEFSVFVGTDVPLTLSRLIGESPPQPEWKTGWNLLPPSQYSIESDSECVQIGDSSVITAIAEGEAYIELQPHGFPGAEDADAKKVTITVVNSGSISHEVVGLSSNENQTLSSDRADVYQFIKGNLYSVRGSLIIGEEKIFLGDNLSLNAIWMGTSVGKLQSTPDEGYDFTQCIEATKIGRGSVKIALPQLNSDGSDPTLKLDVASYTIEFQVQSEVALVGPERLHLPWTGAAMSYTFSASGGSGNFSWSSSSGSALAIADPSSGVVSLTGTGESTVSVCDSSNDRNCKSVQVLVSKPVLQPMKLSRAEFEVSKESVQQVLVVGDEQKPFTDCLNLADKLSVSFPDDVFASVGSAACVPASDRSSSSHFLVGFKAVSAGVSSIITKLDELEHESKIAAFERLHVDPEQLIMSIGGSANLSWSGGPLQWDKDSELVVRLEPDTADVEMSLSAAGSNVLVVSCKRVLEATLELIVHNSVRPELSEPVESSASLSLKCYPPLRLSQRALRLTSGDQALVSVDESKAFGSSVKFSSDNEEIANVSSSGVVVARKRGVTTLRASAFDVFSDSIELVVSFSDFELVADRDWIYVGRSMLLELRSTAEGTFKGADLAGVDFQWSISSNDTAHLTTPFATDLPPGVLMRLWGDAEGDVEVRVIVRVDEDNQELRSVFNMNIREEVDDSIVFPQSSGSVFAPSVLLLAAFSFFFLL